jgi:hypothetical protein
MAPKQQSPASNRYIKDVLPSGTAVGGGGALIGAVPKAQGAKHESAANATLAENLATDFVIFLHSSRSDNTVRTKP